MRKLLILVAIAAVTSGCALKSYSHLGISSFQGAEVASVVAKGSAQKFDSVVFAFHDFLKSGQYAQAYDFFHKDLKAQVSLEKFIEDQKSLDKNFGEEKDFVQMYYPMANILPKIDEALFHDAFAYYSYVTGVYKSVRTKDIVYEFSIVRADGDLKIAGLTYGPCEDECK